MNAHDLQSDIENVLDRDVDGVVVNNSGWYRVSGGLSDDDAELLRSEIDYQLVRDDTS